MFRFVVFLRAINVGGHTARKEKLLGVFASLGYRDVSIFKQSGNIILETDNSNPEVIKMQVESQLRSELGFEVAAFVRTIAQLKQLLQLDPFKGREEESADFQVTFLSSSLKSFPFKLPLRIPNSTADVLSVEGAEVFSITRGHGDGGKPNPFLESHLKVDATTRNWNVIRAIVDLFAEKE